MPARARPLSPHLEVYRWQIGNTLSILHRITGVALAMGFVALTGWLVAVASGAQAYARTAAVFANPIGVCALVIGTFAFFFHLLNGVRHLVWDLGYGFERVQRHASGWVAAGGAVLLTLCVWVVIWRAPHG
jgi:succinate dehydrogenase / fumarate reductase cytochrome b subunit